MSADVAGPESERPDQLTSGWRRAVERLSGGRLAPGPGQAELRRRELVHRIQRPVAQAHHLAVVSMKGGVGRTTVAGLVGLVLAEHRDDRVIAVDAAPDGGNLADRLSGTPAATVRDLVRDLEQIDSWTAMARYAGLAGRLQVLASAQDPAAGDGFGQPENERVCAVLERYFAVIITDPGAGLGHPVTAGVLARADELVLVGASTVDAASRASRTLDWLWTNGFGPLAADAVVVLSSARTSAEIDRERIRAHFAQRCRAVLEIPPDPHLGVGGRIELGRLQPATRDAAYQLAAVVADSF